MSNKTRIISRDEVLKHNTFNDLWVIAKGKVYDITDFIKTHPSHKDRVTRGMNKSGMDVTEHYKQHTKKQREIWKKYYIGDLREYRNTSCILM